MTKREAGRKLVRDSLAEQGIYPEESEIRIIANEMIDWTKPLPVEGDFKVEILGTTPQEDYTWEANVVKALGYDVSPDYLLGWFYKNPKYKKRTSAFVEIILSIGVDETRDELNIHIAKFFDETGLGDLLRSKR